MATVRLFRPGDEPAVAEICILTGDAGGDARPRYAHPEVIPAIYALPYLALEPELAFVSEAEGRVVGYVLGAADTADFARRFRAQWLPTVADRFPEPPPGASGPDESMAARLHHPEEMVHPGLEDYPAHLHIDVAPGHQGGGRGRELMERLLAALAEQGVPRVHLGVAAANTGALAFYARLGFEELSRGEGVRFLGRATS